MTKTKQKYYKFFEILNDAKIYSFNDLDNLELTNSKLVSAQKYPWIKNLADIIMSLYYDTEKYIRDIDGQIFLVDEIQHHDYQNIFKYSCIFPDRMIVSSGEFHYLDKSEYALIDIDFFRKLFWGKDLLLNGIIHISPFSLCTDIIDGEGDINNALIEELTLPDKNKKKIAQLDQTGIGDIEHISFVDKVFIKMPWLSNADISDYLDIINSNKTEFMFYNQYLSKLSNASESTMEYLNQFTADFNDANINIQIALEKKQSELKAKGIAAALSLCLTAIPIFIPQICPVDPQILSAFLGGGSLKQFIDLVPTQENIKSIGKDNPFWVLWKWKNS